MVMTGKRARHWLLVALTALPAGVVLVYATWCLVPGGESLVVWSCGGNYESLKEYVRDFQGREHVRVRYTAAPVMYLLEEALSSPHPPDVVVGRAGPGWIALRQAGLLDRGPDFFAIDPLVIAVAPGNPCAVAGVEDLGRQGLRVAIAPDAMRPKGKVPALFMMAVSDALYPGLVERWENNAVGRLTCGRKLIEPIIQGQADAALVPRSLLHYAGYAGKVEEVPIPAKVILIMKQGGPSLPQCAGVLKVAGERGRGDLARRFVDGLRQRPDWLERHGYLSLDGPRGQDLAELLEVTSPKDMAGWQARLGERLEACANPAETQRRWLKVIYTFGPNHYCARALYESGRLALAAGHPGAAAWSWKTLLRDYPPKGPIEYDSPVLHAGGQPCPVERKSYSHWLGLARAGLAQLPPGASGRPAEDILDDPLVRELFPVHVGDGDPPKNGTREFGLGLHLMVVGDYDFATRDLLKVVTLNYPSRYGPEAEYLLGVCALRRGKPSLATRQWERLMAEFPDSPLTERAAVALAALGKSGAEVTTAPTGMPEWRPCYATHAERGMTYGMRLYDHGLPLFCFKEMMKISSGIYGEEDFGMELRYRAGVACMGFGNVAAAAGQWRQCAKGGDETVWATLAREQLKTSCADVPLPPAPPQPKQGAGAGSAPKGGPGKRFKLAEEFRLAGVAEEGQVILEYLKVLTVARPPEQPAFYPFLAMAGYRLAGCLRSAGMATEAAAQLNEVVNLYPDTPGAQLSAKMLAGAAAATPSPAVRSPLRSTNKAGM